MSSGADDYGVAPDIEITEEMIEAGAKAFIALGLGADDADTVACVVYEAMHKIKESRDPICDRSI